MHISDALAAFGAADFTSSARYSACEMLTQLAVRNVVLIEALDLDFGRGLGVLTGETGAGKSILLDALGLVLGNRAETSLVRSGAKQASVTASFEFAEFPAALTQALEDAGIEIEPGEPLIIRRQVKAPGAGEGGKDKGAGSKAFVNDQPTSMGLLRNLAPILVELHGQHDDRGLVNPRGHRQLLDRFAEADTAKVARNWREWQRASDALEEAREAIDAASAEQDLLLAHLAELTQIEPQAGEEARLAEARSAMQKGERLSGDLEELRHIWEGSESPLSELRTAARRLDRIAGEHKLLAEALGALDRAILEATDAEEKLEEAAEALVHDPAALDAAETRLFDLRALARKHRCEVDELPAKMRELRSMLDAIEGGEAQLDALRIAEREAFDSYKGAAVRLRKARKSAAKKLDEAVARELGPLKLDAARFRTDVQPLPQEKWGPSGMESVEFVIATNPGADFAPLNKIASGGELSRFILALKVALAEKGGAATMIFDEIDRGVGGAVASAIGERLARLASDGQVLVVTHSPQVAARGRVHYKIAKATSGPKAGSVTKTSVDLLDAGGRQEEIARMLSGAEVTPEARAQADRLLEGV